MTTQPTVWKDTFLVNNGRTTGTQSQGVSVGLGNGTFVTVWADDHFTVSNQDPGDINGQLFDIEGNRIGQAFRINALTAGKQDAPAITRLDDGGFVVAYVGFLASEGRYTLNYVRFDAEGNDTHDNTITTAFDTLDTTIVTPSVTTLTNGDFAFSWTYAHTRYTELDGALRNGSTNAIRTFDFQAGNSDESAFDSELSGLSDGKLVSVYVDEDEQGLSVFGINYKLMNAAGTAASGNIEIANQGSDPNVAGLKEGGFAAVWVDNGNDIVGQVRTNSGGLTRATFEIAGGTEDRGSPDVVALDDGGFFVIWRNVPDNTLNGKRFTANGSAIGNAFVIDSGGRNPELALTEDGRILVSWTENGDIFQKILDPRENDIDGTAGNDEIATRLEATTVSAGDGHDFVQGMEGSDSLDGGVGLDTLNGGAGADTLRGGGSIDRLNGGGGADLIYGGLASDFVDGGVGNDTIRVVEGEAGDNVDGGDGTDLLDLSRLQTTTAASVNLGEGEWNTTFTPPVSIAGIENVWGGGAADTLTGNSAANGLEGRNGADTISGGVGNDTISGGNGADHLYGNGSLLAGITENDLINGGGGNDSINGGGGNDTLDGGIGQDTVLGSSGGDSIAGGDDRDVLQGGTGRDTILGGGADDIVYAMDEANPGGSTDGDILKGEAGDDRLHGSAGGDDLTGAAGEDTIEGGDGNDTINAGENDDTLSGGGGNDTLNGGTGVDSMAGGAGNDTYTVDSAGEATTELANEGVDLVRTGIAWELAAHVENLTLNGTADVNGTGNELDNRLTGNAGVNVLDGRLGADTMTGGLGDDTYYVDDSGDLTSEAANGGRDIVRSSITISMAAQIETLILTGSTDVAGTGNSLSNSITGNGGDNRLDGRLGSDTINSGTGADTVAFTTALGAANIDTLFNYIAAEDTIELENAIFTNLTVGDLADEAFVVGAAAAGAEDRIIYNNSTGALFYDSDGTGAAAAVQFAILGARLGLTADDFVVG